MRLTDGGHPRRATRTAAREIFPPPRPPRGNGVALPARVSAYSP